MSDHYQPGEYTLVVTEESVVNNNLHPEASEFTQHQLIPGEYPIVHEVMGASGLLKTSVGHVRIPSKVLQHTRRGVVEDGFTPGQEDRLFVVVRNYQLTDGYQMGMAGATLGIVRKAKSE